MLSDVEAFVWVVRAKGFAAAGRQHHVARSTLSKQVERLEVALGVQLLQRTTRHVGLTEAGRRFFAQSAPAVDALHRAARDVVDTESSPRGTVTVACPFDWARDWLVPSLDAFHEAYPDIELRLRISPRRVDLVAEGIDVAIRGGVMPDSSLVARQLARSAIVFCASPGYLEARGEPRDLDELVGHDVVSFPGPPGGWPLTESVRWNPTGWLQVNDWASLRTVVVAGGGVGLIEIHAVAEDIAEGRLEWILRRHYLVGGGLYAVFPSSQHLSPKVRAFIDFAADLGPRVAPPLDTLVMGS